MPVLTNEQKRNFIFPAKKAQLLATTFSSEIKRTLLLGRTNNQTPNHTVAETACKLKIKPVKNTQI